MLNSVSSMPKVSFCAQPDTQAILEREGAYSIKNQRKADEFVQEKKSSHTGLKVAGALALASAIALPILSRKGVIKTVANLDAAKWYDKCQHYLAKAGEWIAKNTYDPVMKLFSKKA